MHQSDEMDRDLMDDDALSASLPTNRRDSRALTARRAGVRFAAFLVTLVALDVALGIFLPPPEFGADWRMPRDLPTSQLAPFIAHFDRTSAEATEPVVVFLGASPTWGAAVVRERDSVPAAFRRQSERARSPVRVYNFACNGQLLGDTYFIARRVVQDADVTFVQLTYHAFNARWRQGATSRYPDLPARLGVPVGADTAGILGIRQSHRPDITGAVDRWMRRHWYLYGARDAFAARLLGTTPEQRLYHEWEMLAVPGFEGAENLILSESPFEELEPDTQMLILDEFSEAADYRIDERDSEVRMLERLAIDLETQGARAIFYLSPLNTDALASFDLLDREGYAANAQKIRAICVSHGHRFIDFNTDTSLPSAAFADINHTTPAGSVLVAEQLWSRSADLLDAAP